MSTKYVVVGPYCGDPLMAKLKCPQAVKCIICGSYLIVRTPFLPLFPRLWRRGIHSPEIGATNHQHVATRREKVFLSNLKLEGEKQDGILN